jgi:hypothetical protein
MIHFELTGKERAAKLKSTGHFGPIALCGNGSFHATATRHPESTTCTGCKAILLQKPAYLETAILRSL